MTLPASRRRLLPALATVLAGAGLLSPGAVAGQDTTVVADTVTGPVTVVDTLPVDTLPVDSLAADSLQVPDTMVIRALPPVPGQRRARDPGLLARWDRDDLLQSRAITLGELLAALPEAVPLRTGDWGGAEGLVMTGRAGGRLRAFVDGVEETALDGSVVDVAQLTLSGVSSVEVTRAGGETRIFITTVQATEGRPVSLIEAGTGDLETNVFRGGFVHPSAFGGGLTLAFERLDSEGRGGSQDGSLQSVWARYLRPLGDRLTLAAEIRNRTVASLLEGIPPSRSRLTRSVRLRAEIADGLVGEVFAAENRLDLSGDTLDRPAGFPDSLPARGLGTARNAQYGGRLGWELRGLWGQGSVRYLDDGLGRSLLRGDVDGGFVLPGVGGISGRFGLDRAGGSSYAVWGVSGWTEPLLGVSFYGSLDDGDRGWELPARYRLRGVPDSLAGTLPLGSGGTFIRAGARLDVGPLELDGSVLRTEVDRVVPLGNRVDRSVVAFPGEEATGFQVSGSLGLLVEGLSVVGSLQQWDEGGIYRPARVYRGGISFRDTFYPTENLEIAARFLVEGRDPMQVAVPDPATGAPLEVPFYQSWNADIQIRVVTVRLFIRWDNLSLRENNVDIPGYLLPRTRAMYGVRWILRN